MRLKLDPDFVCTNCKGTRFVCETEQTDDGDVYMCRDCGQHYRVRVDGGTPEKLPRPA